MCRFFAGFLTVATLALPAVAAADFPADSDAQDIVFLGPERPLFIRLHLQRDGKSFRAAWREFAEMMFGELDADRDGVLAGAEWETIPSPDLLVIGNPKGAPQGAASVRENIDLDPPDERITPQEFADYLLRVGAGPFALEAQAVPRPSIGPGRRTGDVDMKLFQAFDADGNGTLDRAEFSRGRELFQAFDRDDDEIVTRAEIENPDPFLQFLSPSNVPVDNRTTFLSTDARGRWDGAVARLLEEYGDRTKDDSILSTADGELRIPLERLGLPAALAAPFDSDANAALDARELQRLLEFGAWTAEITIRSGSRADGVLPVEIAPRAGYDLALVRSSANHGVSLAMPGIELTFAADDSTSESRLEAVLRSFKSADTDNNGYLERTEARRIPFFGQAFDSLDADGDDKLFENELTAHVLQRESASRSRTALVARLEGRNLFDVLDADHDGRLGLRELLDAARRGPEWDRNGDNAVSADEVPRLYHVTVGRDQPQFPGALPAPPPVPGRASTADARRGPDWFRRMDRNRDGDISRREFLGPREIFDRLDTNGDGLLSPEEARANP
jgi:Ca2+-binding EF-hand superfamily protein